jgi:hypothetical protein
MRLREQIETNRVNKFLVTTGQNRVQSAEKRSEKTLSLKILLTKKVMLTLLLSNKWVISSVG